MRKPLVSVLVPIYNVEQYLGDCLDSLSNQTMQDIEILLLNDGSTDGSRQIAEEYCYKDDRVSLTSQENRGPGYARNYLLSKAQGEYVFFVDSDDYIDSNTVELLYKNSKLLNTDILVFNGRAFFDYNDHIEYEKKKYFNLNKMDEGVILTGLEFTQYTNGMIKSACIKLFNRDFLLKNSIKFPEYILGEDVEFFYKSMIHAKRVSYIDHVGYYRRYRANSIMTEKNINNIKDRINGFSRITALVEQINEDDFKRIISNQLTMYAFGLWVMSMNRTKNNERNILAYDLYNRGIIAYINNNRYGLIQIMLSLIVLLPNWLMFMKILVCKIIKKVYRVKTRLLM